MTGAKLRILVLTNMYPTPEKPWWGTFVEEQVEDLRRLNVDVSVLDFDATDDRGEYRRAARRFHSTVRSGQFDLVHAHYGLTGAIAVSQRRVPVVTTFHGGDYTGLIRWHAAVSFVVSRLCTPIVVTTDGRRRLRLPNAAVIPAGVNTDLFQPADRGAARRRLGLDEGASYALLLGGRDDANKRPDLFDAAVEHARQQVPDLRSLSLDQVSRAEVVHLMNAADVAVLTSDREGLPVALREALSCMTPVVSVPVGSVATVLDDLAGCPLVARDPAQLGAAIVAALSLERSPLWRARAEETSGQAIAEKLVEVYDTLVAKRRRKRH
jgi:teichuronic acid biosynthesis glycosyltransferase TuaC